MSMSDAEAAAVIGAKESEIKRVRDDLVTTIDGTTVRVDGGQVVAIVDPRPGYNGPLAVEFTPDPDDEPAPKRRGRKAPAKDDGDDVVADEDADS